MIKNLGARFQNTLQSLGGAGAQSKVAQGSRPESEPNASNEPRSAVKGPNERSLAGQLRQRLRAAVAKKGLRGVQVQECAVPVRKYLRTSAVMPEPSLEPLTKVAMPAPRNSAPPSSQRLPSVPSEFRVFSSGVRHFARQAPQRANKVVPAGGSERLAETVQPQPNPRLFNHVLAEYDQTFPFQERYGFNSEKEAHAKAKAQGLKEHDYRLKTEDIDGDDEPMVTMELRSTATLKQNWKKFAFDPSTEFNEAQILLREDAEQMMQNFKPSTTRPAVSLPQNSTMQTLFKTVLGKTDTLVIGECHSDLASKKAVIDTVPTLRAASATHFFLEHVPADTFKNEIAEYNAAPAGSPIPRALDDYLSKLDSNYMGRPTSSAEKTQTHEALVKKYGFKAMVKSIHDGGMELCCIDREVSYHEAGNFKGYTPSESRDRGMTFNYLAAQQKARLPEGAKSVWFIGEAHANTHKGVPGQAELLNGIAVVIGDKHIDSDETGLRVNVKNYNGFDGLNPDLVMTVDLSKEQATNRRDL